MRLTAVTGTRFYFFIKNDQLQLCLIPTIPQWPMIVTFFEIFGKLINQKSGGRGDWKFRDRTGRGWIIRDRTQTPVLDIIWAILFGKVVIWNIFPEVNFRFSFPKYRTFEVLFSVISRMFFFDKDAKWPFQIANFSSSLTFRYFHMEAKNFKNFSAVENPRNPSKLSDFREF